MTQKTILVAGGAGYIGSHFCYVAAQHGFQLVVVDRLRAASPQMVAFRRQAVQWGVLEVADIGDAAAMAAILHRHKPIAALCFAALIEVGESTRDPALYWENNFASAARFFQTLAQAGVRYLVFSSTAAVYGNPKAARPLREDDALAPINPYGMTKLACEILLQGHGARPAAGDDFMAVFGEKAKHLLGRSHDFNQPFFPGIKNVVFRYFNAAGAAFAQGLGEMHEPETHLIPNAVLAALGKRGFGTPDKLFTIHGRDYPTPDGTCIRDFVHVLDIAEAHVAGLHYLLEGGRNAVFNLGSGQGYSVQTIVDQVRQIAGQAFPLAYGPRREGDPSLLVASAERAHLALNWQPKRDLNTILTDAYQFHQQHP